MRIGNALRVAAALTLATGFFATTAGAVTIDDFTTNQPAPLSDPPGGSSNTANAGILGGNRGVVVDNLAGAGPTTVNVTGGNLVFLVTATTPDSRGEARLSWDGDTNPLVLSPTGLGGANLTTSNASGFQLGFVSSTVVAELELTVYSSAANFSRAARRVPVGGAQTVRIAFSEFRDAGGTGADFASVGAIEMTVRSGDGTFSITDFLTTAPVLAATKVDLQVVDTDGDTRVDPGDRVRYTVTLTNTGNEATSVDLTDTVDPNTTLIASSVSSTPLARNDQYGWFGNVTLSVDGTPFPTLLANDSDPDGDTVTVQAGSFPATSAQGGTLTLVDASTGEFTYAPPAGFKGVDSFAYTIVDDDTLTSTATATITLQGIVWFVDNTNTPPGTGTFANPFATLPQAEAVAGDGDIVYVRTGSGSYDTGGANGYTMSLNQQLLGEGVALTLAGTEIVAAGAAPTLTNNDGTPGRGVTLGAASTRTVRGLTIASTGGAKLFGNAFGTLNTDTVALTGNGQALDLTTGVLAATFSGISSTNSAARGINLDAATGTLSVTGSTSITDSAQAGIRVVNGGSTYSFGTTALSSTNSGLDLQTNATSTFNFTSLAVTTDAGPGLLASNSGTINLGGTGNTIVASGGAALAVTSTSFGAGATFSTVSSSGSPTNGIFLDTVSGPLTMNGGSIATAAGIDFDVNAGSANITYAGSITNTASRSVEITARTGGTVTLSGNISDTGTGINVASNTGGTINFSGAAKTLNTGANAAVTLATNTGATINFTGGGLDIDTTSGAGFTATGGATGISVQGTSNSITSSTGTALDVTATNIGAPGLTFHSINSNGGTSGIVLNGTGSNGLTVTGDGTLARNGSGGTINNKSGDAVALTNANNVSLRSMNLTLNGSNPATAADAAGTAGNHTVQVSGGSNLVLSGVHIQGTRGTGFLALNLGGTNRLNSNTRFEDTLAGAGHNLYVNNTSTNMTLFELDNVQMVDNASNHTNFFFANTGTSNMTLEVKNSSLFEDLGTQALTLAAGGTAATSGTLTSSIVGCTFQNAKGVGENNVGVLVGNGAAHNATVQGNTFSNLAKDGTIANTSILRTQNSGGRMTATIIGNTIQNIAYAAGSGGRHAIGHVFEPVAYTASDFSNLIIQNNVVSNVTYPSLGNNREAIFIDFRTTASNGEVSILGNNFNMPTSGAQQAIEMRFRQTNASTVPVLVQGNTVTHNTANVLLDVDAEDGANVQLTVNSANTFTNSNGTPGATIAVASEDPAAAGGPPTMCVNIAGNTLQSGAGTISLDETAGTMNVTQASTAAMAAANGIPGGNVTSTGTPAFGQPACVLP